MSELDKTLNDKNNIQDIPKILPMLPVRDIVVFPAMVLPLAVGREKSIRALEESMTSSRYIFVVTQKNLQIEDPTPDDIYQIGTVCEVLQMLKMPDGTLKVLVECVSRAEWTEFKLSDKGYVEVGVNIFDDNIEKTPEVEA
ncbi:MAG: LON peptidase substrate-binding domain-containing protein, partial [Endomicrobiia bacterium]